MTRRYLITGGTSGIGRAVAQHLTGQGDAVWITGTRDATLAPALADGVAAGGGICDITDTESVATAFDAARDGLGGLDGVFVNAGIDGAGGPPEDIDPTVFARVLDVNVVGSLRCAQAAYRVLDRPGSIVVNASVNAVRPERHFADYNASKAATESLAKSLALDWSGEDLCVTAVCPGYFPSRMTDPYLDDPVKRAELLSAIPLGRIGEPREIGATVAFLLSGTAPFLTGSVVAVAGAANL